MTLLDRMLAAGADVNAPINVLKSTPLLMATAAEQTRPDALRWLLDKGADPNAEGINGGPGVGLGLLQGRPEQNRPAQALRRQARRRNARSLVSSRLKALTTPALRWKRVWRCCFRLAPAVFKARGCITCHNQALPMQVSAVARQKGIPIDEQLLEMTLKQVLAVFKPVAEQAMQGDQLSDSPGLQVGYIMTALAAQGYPADDMTASLTHLVVSLQRADGSWLTERSLTASTRR